jgi:hypothetical protein
MADPISTHDSDPTGPAPQTPLDIPVDETRPRGAVANTQDTAALLLANGASPSEVAVQIGRHPRTIYLWLQDEDFQNLVRGYKERIVLSAARTMTKFLLASERVADNMLALADDHTHNRHFDALKYVLDKLMPHKEIREVKTTHAVPDAVTGVLEELRTSMAQLRELKSGAVQPEPKVLSGGTAIEAYGTHDPEAPTGE